MYDQIVQRMEESGQLQGHFVATATGSDTDNKGYQVAVLVRIDANAAATFGDLNREGGCCTIF